MNSEMLHAFKQRVFRPRILLAAAVALAVLPMTGWLMVGTSPSAVTGRVTYQGKPVVVGAVIVVDSKGQAVAAPIANDGTFRVNGVARGPAQIAVVSPDPAAAQARISRMAARGTRLAADSRPPAVDRGKWFPIPNRFADPATSGLCATIDRETTCEINLP